MDSVKQLSKLTESLSAVKAQLEEQIIGLRKYLRVQILMNSSLDYKWFSEQLRQVKRRPRRGYVATDPNGRSFMCRFMVPKRIVNYREFKVETMCGTVSARLRNYRESLVNVRLLDYTSGNIPEAAIKSFNVLLDNTVVLDAICDVSSKVVPKIRRCDLQYWHSPLLEPVFAFCTGLLRSIGIEYCSSPVTIAPGDYVPQYLDLLTIPTAWLDKFGDTFTATYLTLIDAIQLQIVVDGLIDFCTDGILGIGFGGKLS